MADYYFRIKKYLEMNGEKFEYDKIKLVDKGRGPFISEWKYGIKKPVEEELKNLSIDVDDMRLKERISDSLVEIPTVNNNVLNILDKYPEGCLMFDKTNNKLKIWVDKKWVSFSPEI